MLKELYTYFKKHNFIRVGNSTLFNDDHGFTVRDWNGIQHNFNNVYSAIKFFYDINNIA